MVFWAQRLRRGRGHLKPKGVLQATARARAYLLANGEEVSEFDGVGSVKDQPILAQTSTCDHEDGGPDSVGAA